MILYGDGDYAGARIKFQGAYDRSKDPRLLWNIAACEKNGRHYAKVVGLVQKYLATSGDLISDSDRKDAQDLLSAIESFTVALTLTVSEPDADLYVDGELAGKSPLPGPLTVDIGTRQIDVRKQGFLPFSQAIAVGETKSSELKVALTREVHEGELIVRAPPGATLAIDGKPVGAGQFDGKLASGGHTLHVEARGMRPYQSEVVIQDRDKRTIDVVLEPIAVPVVAAPPPEPEGPLHGFELGLRMGYGFQENKVEFGGPPIHKADEISIPFRLDIGYRLGRPTYLGVFAEYATLDRTDTCGVARHGPHEDYPGDPAIRYGYTSCWAIKVGTALVFHVLPRTLVDPYFGFEAAIHGLSAHYRSFDPTSSQTTTGKDGGGTFQPGIQLGIDAHPARGLGAGIYTVFGPSFGGEGTLDQSGNCGSNGCASQSGSADSGWHVAGGARVAYTFP